MPPSLRLNDLVNYLETTDRGTVRAIAVVRRMDIANAAKVQVERTVVAIAGAR